MLSSTIPSILRGSTRSAWRRRISSCKSSRSTRKLWSSVSNSRHAASAWRAPCSRKPRILTAVASKSCVAGNSDFSKAWKPPGWVGAVMTGSSRDSRQQPLVGADSNSSPIPDITVCSSTACKNAGGNFVAITTVWTGSLAMAFASGVT